MLLGISAIIYFHILQYIDILPDEGVVNIFWKLVHCIPKLDDMPFLSMKIIFSKIMISLIEIGFADVFQRLCLTYFILFPFSGTSSQSSKKDGRRRSNTFIKDRPNSSMAAAGITFHRGFSHEDIWLLHQILIILMAQYSLHWRQLFMIVFPLTMSIKHQNVSSYFTFHHYFSSHQRMCMNFYSMC